MTAEHEFESELAERSGDEPSLMVDVEGFEGPLDLLLTLARQQKVDLAKISILALADQYLAFIEEARKMRLELAADYLVMAAWLAYLKSRLLLPEPHPAEGLSAEEMANALALRLRRLEAIRKFAEQLMSRPQLGRDIFQRGQPEPIAEIKHPQWSATLYDLLSAYASRRQIQSRSGLVHTSGGDFTCSGNGRCVVLYSRDAIETAVGRYATRFVRLSFSRRSTQLPSACSGSPSTMAQ